ncbi:MAG: hypothetical protein WEB04_09545 [Dehalococcoidia bacterium]
MAIPATYVRILKSLKRLSDQGRLSWVEGATHYVVHVSFGAYSLKLSDVGLEDDTEYELTLVNSEGNEIDSVVISMGDEEFPLALGIFKAARTEALGVRRALDEIAEELAGLEKGLDSSE